MPIDTSVSMDDVACRAPASARRWNGQAPQVAIGVGHVERHRRDRAGVDVRRALLHHAERVALWVGEHHPWHQPLADVGGAGAQCEQPLDHRLLLLAAPEVEVESLWLNGWLRHPLEAQVEHRAVGYCQPGLERVRLVGQRLGAQRRLPEPAERRRVDGVDDDVLQVHVLSVGRGVRLRQMRALMAW